MPGSAAGALDGALAVALVEAAPDALVVVDDDGRIELVNAQTEALFGYPRVELVGAAADMLIPAAFGAPDGRDRAEVVSAGRPIGLETAVYGRRRDGSEFPIEVRLSSVMMPERTLTAASVRDISARRRIEESLREAEERFRLAFEQAPNGIALVGLDGRFRRVNRAFCELVGYTPEELSERTFQTITHPDDVEKDVAFAGKLARGEVPLYQRDKRYFTKNGAIVHASLTASVVRASDDRPLYYVTQIEDITQRRADEENRLRLLEEQREQARFLDAVVENIPAMVFVKDARTLRFRRFNRAGEELLGWSRASMIGRTDYDFFSKEQADDFQRRDRETLRSGKVVDIEEPIRTRDGERWLHTMKIPLPDAEGEPAHLLGISIDITAGKLAERERDASLRWLRAVLDQCPIAMLLAHEATGERLELNDAARRLFGRDLEEVARSSGLLSRPDGTPVSADDAPVRQALRGHHLEAAEYLLARSVGDVVPVVVGASPVRDADGVLLGAVAIAYDVTSTKELERIRAEWNSIVAHDLRQPLGAILLQIRLLAEQNKDVADLHAPVERISRSVQRLNRMINDLLDLSRLEARHLTLSTAPVDLVALLRACRDDAALQAPDRAFELWDPGSIPLVVVDADRVMQVVHNLLTNAVKYGAPGTPVIIDVNADGQEVSVAVVNEGPGIESQEIPGLFQRFKRTKNAKLAGIEGVGLGLFITRALVEAHGGRIDVESTPGKTTTFRFTLPLTRAQRPPAHQALRAPRVSDSTGPPPVTICGDNRPPGDASSPKAHARQLLELTTRLSEPLPAEEVARVVVDQAAVAVGAHTAFMWTVEDPPTHATLVRSIGFDQHLPAGYTRIPLEPWLPMGDAILRREVLFFESRAEFRERYPVAEEGTPTLEAFRELSYACLPFVVHGRAIGGVALVFPGTRTFDEDERVFLSVLAHHAAQALERANLFERERATRERLQCLQQLTAALSSAASVEEIAQLATRIGTEALGVSSSAMWATDERGDLRVLGAHQTTETILGPFRHMPGDSVLPVARVARERRPAWCESESDAEHSVLAEALGRGEGFRAYGALPLVRDDRVLGVLAFSAGRPRRFSPEERSFAATIAEHCADALARARLYGDARRAERRLESVLKQLPVGVIVAAPPDGELLFTNDAMADLWRATSFPSRGEDRGAMLRASFPDGRPLAKEDWAIVRALRGEVVEGEELRITRLDGAEGWIHVRAAPIRRDDGTIEAAVGTAIDVTAEKAARASGDEASRAKDEFLAMLGHELRNPLAPIVAALHLMRLRGGGALERERAVIERQVKQLTRLVDDLLDVSRAVRGELSLRRTRIDVAGAVADAIEVARPLVEERKHELTVSSPGTGLFVEADRERLAQVITNLITNAAKFTPSGGHIRVLARGEAGHVALEIADDGAGIAPELIDRMFDAFTQGRQGLDRKQGGLGLGLAIARQLVVAHGGTIEARSAGPGRGTTMVVRLPRAAPPSVAPGNVHDVPSGESRGAPRRVLVVDDNPDAAVLLQEGLMDAGHEVRTASDGPSALQVVRTFMPEIAFLDIGLPVMDGYELAQRLRGVPGLADTPLVAITGYAQDDDRRRALASGFNEHLAKPLEVDRILECIVRLCPVAR